MTSAIDKDDFHFENKKYLPEISRLYVPTIGAHSMENHMSNTLTGRTELKNNDSNPNHSVYFIDSSIRVKIPSDQFRQTKVDHWEQKHSTAKVWAWVEGAASVVFGGLAALLEDDPYVAIALGVASVASLVFAAFNISRTYAASHQIEGWKASPLEKIANERVKAYREGFPYVYRNNLKLTGSSNHQVLLPSEVNFLFERYSDQFYQKLLSQNPTSEQGKTDWLHAFTTCNPVSKAALEYGNDEISNKYKKYDQVSYDYEVLHKQLIDMRGAFNELRRERREETDKVIRGINQNRDLALLPFSLMLDHWSSQARSERDSKLQNATKQDEIDKIKEDYSATLRKYHTYHTAAIIPVNLFFDSQVSHAKDSLNNILKEIARNEASSHAPYFDYARGLLDYARQLKVQPTLVYAQQPFNAAQVFNIPAPSAPPVVNINFIQQAQNQRPIGMDESSYQDYLRFISWQQQQNRVS